MAIALILAVKGSWGMFEGGSPQQPPCIPLSDGACWGLVEAADCCWGLIRAKPLFPEFNYTTSIDN